MRKRGRAHRMQIYGQREHWIGSKYIQVKMRRRIVNFVGFMLQVQCSVCLLRPLPLCTPSTYAQGSWKTMNDEGNRVQGSVSKLITSDLVPCCPTYHQAAPRQKEYCPVNGIPPQELDGSFSAVSGVILTASVVN